jgi:hypothetical protein
VPWHDVHQSDGWHLNPERVPMPTVPANRAEGRAPLPPGSTLRRPPPKPGVCCEFTELGYQVWDEHEQWSRLFYAAPAPYPQRACAPAHEPLRGSVVKKEEEDTEENDEPLKKALEDSEFDELA